MNVYALFDVKMREYGGLVTARNDAAVVRGLKDSLEHDVQSPVGKHPEDFELHCVGTFDQEGGFLVGQKRYRFVELVSVIKVGGWVEPWPEPVLELAKEAD